VNVSLLEFELATRSCYPYAAMGFALHE